MVMFIVLGGAQAINAVKLEITNKLEANMIVDADGRQKTIAKDDTETFELPNKIQLKKEGGLRGWHSSGIQEKIDDIRVEDQKNPVLKASITVSGSGLHYTYSGPVYTYYQQPDRPVQRSVQEPVRTHWLRGNNY